MTDHPMTIEQEIAVSAYPAPVPTEDLGAYARRVAQVAAHQGIAWALTHMTPTVIRHPEDVARLHDQDGKIAGIGVILDEYAQGEIEADVALSRISVVLHGHLPEKTYG